jgi:transcriptional regulator with XRE-family HTH domain
MTNLRSYRAALGLSQSKLARLSGVSRLKICLFELGDGKLSADDESRIHVALRAEAMRLQSLAAEVNLGESASATSSVEAKA